MQSLQEKEAQVKSIVEDVQVKLDGLRDDKHVAIIAARNHDKKINDLRTAIIEELFEDEEESEESDNEEWEDGDWEDGEDE